MADINLVKFENNYFKFDLSRLIFWRKRRFDKSNLRILFVDNELMPVADNLKAAGWLVTKVNDIKNIDEEIVRNSQIIFVDYKGVGRIISPQMEGIVLIYTLKNAYGDAKRIILYSATRSLPNHIILEGHADSADNKIRKNADTSQFIKMINDEMKLLK